MIKNPNPRNIDVKSHLMEHRLYQTMENPNPGNIEYQKMECLNPTERLLYQKL